MVYTVDSLPLLQWLIHATRNEITQCNLQEWFRNAGYFKVYRRWCLDSEDGLTLSEFEALAAMVLDYFQWNTHLFMAEWFVYAWLCEKVNSIQTFSWQWRHNKHNGISNRQPHDCLLNSLFKAQIKENIKAPRHWPLCEEFTDDRWIPRTKGQQRGKCFHLMTLSYDMIVLTILL